MIYRVWCRNKGWWENHPVAITPAGNIMQFNNGKWHLCNPETHLLVFAEEKGIITALEGGAKNERNKQSTRQI